MATELPISAPLKGPLPPILRRPDFLAPAERDALLDWILASRERFKPAKVTDGESGFADPTIRVALKLRDLGPLRQRLSDRLLAALPDAVTAIGGKRLSAPTLELELTAYGDGAFYAPHTDIMTGPARKAIGPGAEDERLLSAVYYVHRQPAAFSGGALRLYRWGAEPEEATDADWSDVPPDDNSLVAFPTWARHEVRPVACPSGRFEDYRFALNCWYCGKLSG